MRHRRCQLRIAVQPVREYFPRSASRFLVEEYNSSIGTADLLPVCDLAFVDVADLRFRQRLHAAVVDIRGDDERHGVATDFRGEEMRARIRSEEHTSELQSHSFISYAVF